MSDRVTLRSVGSGRVEATNGTTSMTLDVPKYDGGAGNGFGPHETLLAALGACTTMTLEIYAKRKQWPLEGVEISLDREPAPVGQGDVPQKIAVSIKLLGPLDDAQKGKLAEIAQKCPVYKTLKGEIDITERLAS